MSSAGSQRKRKRTAECWKHFVDKGDSAECKYCETVISIKGGGTSSMNRHISSCGEAPDSVKAKGQKTGQMTIIDALAEQKSQKEKEAVAFVMNAIPYSVSAKMVGFSGATVAQNNQWKLGTPTFHTHSPSTPTPTPKVTHP